jgi:hypothetical protein
MIRRLGSLNPRRSGAGKRQRMKHGVKFAICMTLAASINCSPVSAIEQCRFIQAKADREACYERQEIELAAKRKARESENAPLKPLEKRDPEDIQLSKSLRSICRGC